MDVQTTFLHGELTDMAWEDYLEALPDDGDDNDILEETYFRYDVSIVMNQVML